MIAGGEQVNQLEKRVKPRVRLMVILALALTPVMYLLAGPLASLGVLVGLGVNIFNYFLTTGALRRGEGLEVRRAHNLLLGRAMMRMGISLGALLLALPVGISFVLGLALGLVVEMLTYCLDLLGGSRAARHEGG